MKRMVEMVGIGDTGPLSGTLTVAPLHVDDVALTLLGSQNGTQTADMLIIRNSAGTAQISGSVAGVLYAASMPTINATTLCGTTIKEANAAGGSTAVMTKTVGVCATTAGAVVSAAYITCTGLSSVFIEANITAFCTAGAAAASGAGYHIVAHVTSGGKDLTAINRVPLSGSATMSAWAPSVSAGAGTVALTILGSAGHSMIWGYELSVLTLA